MTEPTDIPPMMSVPPTPPPPTGFMPPPEPEMQTETLPLDEAKRWNWGAGLLAPFWLGAMRMWGWFNVYLVIIIITYILASMDSPAVKLPQFGMLAFSWYLIRYGNTLAWRSRPWSDLPHFKRTQRIWLWWGLGALVLQVLLGILAAVLVAMSATPQQY